LSPFSKGIGAHGGVWECPDLFPLTITETGETKWMLLVSLNPGGPQGGSATRYFVGDFDGTNFAPDNDFKAPQWIDQGSDNYAGVTWSDAPDGPSVFIGWMSNWKYASKVPAAPWRSAMTLPRDLSLRRTSDGLRLVSARAAEFETLRGAGERDEVVLKDGEELLNNPWRSAKRSEFMLTFQKPLSGTVALALSNNKGERDAIGYDPDADAYFSDRTMAGDSALAPGFAAVHRAPRESKATTVNMRIIADRACAELFADGGATAITTIFFPSAPFTAWSVMREGDPVSVAVAAYAIEPSVRRDSCLRRLGREIRINVNPSSRARLLARAQGSISRRLPASAPIVQEMDP
jgi:fructan beta-fructosidase